MSSLTITQAIDSLTAAVDNLTASSQAMNITLSNVFAIPDGSDFATLYALGLTLPVVCFLVSWSVGKLISMFKE